MQLRQWQPGEKCDYWIVKKGRMSRGDTESVALLPRCPRSSAWALCPWLGSRPSACQPLPLASSSPVSLSPTYLPTADRRQSGEQWEATASSLLIVCREKKCQWANLRRGMSLFVCVRVWVSKCGSRRCARVSEPGLSAVSRCDCGLCVELRGKLWCGDKAGSPSDVKKAPFVCVRAFVCDRPSAYQKKGKKSGGQMIHF